MNAGDYIVGDLLHKIVQAPYFIPVMTMKAGLFRQIIKPKSYKMGLPYCHQGIVFENKNLFYDLKYKLAADYDFYLRHGYKDVKSLGDINGPYVYYDNFGTSQKHHSLRDHQLSIVIRKNFGVYHQFKFLLVSYIKYALKLVIRKLINRPILPRY